MSLPKKTGIALGMITSLFLLSLAVFAFTPPTQGPPFRNILPPINVTSEAQHKEGALGIDGTLTVNSGMFINPYVSGRSTCSSTIRGMIWSENPGYALDFNGTSDYVETGNDAINFGDDGVDNPFSISFWVNPNSFSTQSLVTKMNEAGDREYSFQFETDRLYFYLFDASNGSYLGRHGNVLDINLLNQWMYLTTTYDGRGGNDAREGIKIYMNGNRVDVSHSAQNPSNYISMRDTGGNILIGSRYLSHYFNGLIDDVRIYDRVLSASEIQALYEGDSVSRMGLVGWWLMDEGTGGTVTDYSGNGNTGTITGASWVDGRGPQDAILVCQKEEDGSYKWIALRK